MQEEPLPDDEPLRSLAPLVYEECRQIANSYFRSEKQRASIQPTLLVHEAWLRLSRSSELALADRNHLRALIALTMRRILQEHARVHQPAKVELSLAANLAAAETSSLDLWAVNQALDALEQHDRRLCRAVVLRIYGGMRFREIAPLLRVQERHARTLFADAVEWLRRYLTL